jgi:hypothetical protein
MDIDVALWMCVCVEFVITDGFSSIQLVYDVLAYSGHVSGWEWAFELLSTLYFCLSWPLLVNLLLIFVFTLVNFYFKLALVIFLFYFFDFVQQHIPAASTSAEGFLTLAASLLWTALLQWTDTDSAWLCRACPPNYASDSSTFCCDRKFWLQPQNPSLFLQLTHHLFSF